MSEPTCSTNGCSGVRDGGHRVCRDCLRKKNNLASRQYAERKRRRDGRAVRGTEVTVRCSRCSKSFSYVVFGKRRHLCDECRQSARAYRARVLGRTATCEECGKTFPAASRGSLPRFCGEHKRRCRVDQCGRVVHAKGYCAKHWALVKRTGSPSKRGRKPPAVCYCVAEGCGRRAVSRSLCNKHYMRWLQHGTLEPVFKCVDCNGDVRRSYRGQKKYCPECEPRGFAARWRERLLTEQHGRCAICGSCEPKTSWGWHLDHRYGCEHQGRRRTCRFCIRGVLCHKCNTIYVAVLDEDEAACRALAALKSKSVLCRAARYIVFHSEPRQLRLVAS